MNPRHDSDLAAKLYARAPSRLSKTSAETQRLTFTEENEMNQSTEKLKQVASLLKYINSNRTEFSPVMLTALQGVESIAFEGVKNAKPTPENVMLDNFKSGQAAVTAAINFWQWCSDAGGAFENNIYLAIHDDVEKQISDFADDLARRLLPEATEHLQLGQEADRELQFVLVTGMLRWIDLEMKAWIKACPDSFKDTDNVAF